MLVGVIVAVLGVFYVYKELTKVKSTLNQVSKTPAYDTFVKPLPVRPPPTPIQPPPAPVQPPPAEPVEEVTKKEL
jgi:hypothetical protein